MSTTLRSRTNDTFVTDVKKLFGEEFTRRQKVLGFPRFGFTGFPIGPREVNTAKITNEIVPGRIKHTALETAKNRAGTLITIAFTAVVLAGAGYLAYNNPTQVQSIMSAVKGYLPSFS